MDVGLAWLPFSGARQLDLIRQRAEAVQFASSTLDDDRGTEPLYFALRNGSAVSEAAEVEEHHES